ncbi:glutamate receptor ionotropic, kainate 2-like [Tachypleus tridentatus]|uniref:glutamate receptor ionotropic, kainate 2-like n=1 Tax=Tachypleus tridentatus TaxID=6853 RepID=UPI003FCF1BED
MVLGRLILILLLPVTVSGNVTVSVPSNYRESCSKVSAEREIIPLLFEVVIDMAQHLRLSHVTLILPHDASGAGYYDCIVSGLQKVGITTIVLSVKQFTNLDESTFQSKFFSYEVSKNYTPSLRFVFVFHETDNHISFLQMIICGLFQSFLKNRCLQHVRWVFFLSINNRSEEHFDSNLDIPCLCSMIIIQENGTKLGYNMYAVSSKNYHCRGLKRIGKWTSQQGFNGHLSRYLHTQDSVDFLGEKLVVSAVSISPFIVLDKDPKETLKAGYGIEVHLLNTLARKMNFRYVIRTPLDGEWGRKLPNGTWTGLVGMVQRKEADIAIAKISITEERKEAVDFTIPYIYDVVTFVTRTPRSKRRTLSIITPFTWQHMLTYLCNAMGHFYFILGGGVLCAAVIGAHSDS